MRSYILIIFTIISWNRVDAQGDPNTISGHVSFVSSQNIYVRFNSTNGISAGDTLYSQIKDELIPSLVVNNLSSLSCVCTALSNKEFAVSDIIIAKVMPVAEKSELEAIPKKIIDISPPVVNGDTTVNNVEDGLKQKIRGSLSLVSYSDFSNTVVDNSQRFRYTISLNAGNIGDSKFSAETYMSFRHKAGEWQEVKDNVFNALKIYNLSVRYDINKSTHLSLGRRINPKIASIGAIDGMQIEKSVNNFVFGAVAGFRPDYKNYGLNTKLFQYGALIALNTSNNTGFTETSLAFMQQTNNLKTDRRFLYFQHTNNIIRNLTFFGTLEADLYRLQTDSLNNQMGDNIFSFTGLYASLRLRLINNLSISGSYDARKNVIYYETYKTFIDRILENEMRQGFRFNASYRITRDMTLGFQSGYRFLKSDPHSSKNLYAYFTYAQIPGVNISATLSATYLESNYVNGKIFGLRISRDLFKGKLQTDFGYRYVDYTLPENFIGLKQNIGEINISWQILKNIYLSGSYEGTIEKNDRYNRLYMQLRIRF